MMPGVVGLSDGTCFCLKKWIAKSISISNTEQLCIFGKNLTVAELQGRHFAKDHIYSGCKRTEELSACKILKFVQAPRREATKKYNQEPCNTELDHPTVNLNRK